MNTTQLNSTASTLLRLYARKMELVNEIAEQEEKLKQYMTDNNITYLPLESANVSWVDVESTVLDTKKVKEFLNPVQIAELSKVRFTKRFTCKVA